ncbi:MAG: electron transfer flavoprotein subunit beta/FixA family protein [Bacteriovoracaceae bacterium]|nr:electron transfer flavoprotein subunit beta/FixA family protein [Bacteriovoracaceae bacterium]
MNIFVCVKQVPDTETKIIPNSDGTFIETNAIKWIVNPYDEYAIEQAMLVKAASSGSTVTAVRVGAIKDTEVLRTAMAMGADDSILVETEDNLDSFMTAKALKGAIEKSGKTPDLIFMGKQAIDSDCLQVPSILAQMMNLPSVSNVMGYEANGNTITLKREVEGGTIEIYEVAAPVIAACTKGLNTPRYPSLPGIMKAKRKPLAKHSLADIGVTADDRKVSYSNFELPPEKPPGKKFDAMEDDTQLQVVKEVVGLLRTEAKVI